MELDTRTKAYIQVLTNQRNSAMDSVAQLAAEVAGLQEELAVVKGATPVQHPAPMPPATPAPAPQPTQSGVTPWNLHPVQLWPVPTLSGSGDQGFSVSFVADPVAFPNGISIGGVDEHQPTIPKDYVISTAPFDFNPVGPGGIKQGAGTTMGPIYAWFGTPTGPVQPYQIVLNAGQTYYLNVREYKDPSDPTPRGNVYSQFVCYARIE